MTFITHTIVTAAGVQLFGLKGMDVFWAYTFGVFIDLDHLIKIPLYLRKYGFKKVRFYNWKTPLQEPISLSWILPLSIYFGTLVPVVAFCGHLALDYLYNPINRPLMPFSDVIVGKILPKIPSWVKEGVVLGFFGCLYIVLYLIKK
jgi:hypothetical protein